MPVPLFEPSDATLVVSVLAAQLAADGGAAAVLGAAVVLGAGAGAAGAAPGAGDGVLSAESEPNQRLTLLPRGSDVSSVTEASQPAAGAAVAVLVEAGSDAAGSDAAGAGGGGLAAPPPKLGTSRLQTLELEADSPPGLASVNTSALATTAPPASAMILSTSLELDALRAKAISASPWLDWPAAL